MNEVFDSKDDSNLEYTTYENDPSIKMGLRDCINTDNFDAGVWTHSVGTSHDVEVDEIFVILEGKGEVDILDDNGIKVKTLILSPGAFGCLKVGTKTEWRIQEPLKKVYVMPASSYN